MTDTDEVRRLRLENERLQNSLNGINEKFVGNIIAIQSRANVEIDKFRAENEKLRAALDAASKSLLRAKEVTNFVEFGDAYRAAAAALKEAGDD